MEKLPKELNDNGIHYTLHGDYYIPDLAYPRDDRPIGKRGRMHLTYLKEHKPGLYSQMVLSGKLNSYLADLDERTQARLDLIVRQMAAAEVVDENIDPEVLKKQKLAAKIAAMRGLSAGAFLKKP